MRKTRPWIWMLALALGLFAGTRAQAAGAARSGPPGICRTVDLGSTHPTLVERWVQHFADTTQDPFLRELARWVLDGYRLRYQDCLRLNQIQVIGTHNSYRERDFEPYFTQFLGLFGSTAAALDYAHIPLDQQFETQHIRQIELDVFADSAGGLFSNRLGPTIFGYPPESGVPELDLPGFKVLHIQDIDFTSSCYTFIECLDTIKGWSDAHPGHLPIAILVELKDDVFLPEFGTAIPEFIGPAQLDALDAEIRSVFPPQQLIVPDDVRRGRPTLEEGVLVDGWPTLAEARGRVLFLMDNAGQKRDFYRDGHPSLEGRVIFTNSVPGDSDAAFVKLNDPIGDADTIHDVVAAGYLVRTRADADTVEARSGNTVPRDTALASGAQFVSTDYPVDEPKFAPNYFVELPGGPPARCNPVSAPARCDSAILRRIETLQR
jgi:hypothetical protein